MKKHGLFLLLISQTLLIPQTLLAQNPPEANPDTGERHELVIADFKTESGVTLPQARVVYGTYGHINAAKDNVVLLPSHYMAKFHGYEWLIGQDKALDPSELFLVATELFGNGSSSSPSNTPEPFHGPRFPVMTIRDNVEAVHRLLTDELKITHLRAIVGFSMGAEQAFQWAVSYPDFADRIVATYGKMLSSWHRAPGRPNRGHHYGLHIQRRRLHYSSDERAGDIFNRLGRVAVFSGMVAQGAVASALP
jgi:homoserine O-acetyltransferase/O-succinyltransferase